MKKINKWDFWYFYLAILFYFANPLTGFNFHRSLNVLIGNPISFAIIILCAWGLIKIFCKIARDWNSDRNLVTIIGELFICLILFAIIAWMLVVSMFASAF